ncbi:hypothetical protein Y032_0038g3564 [Ancylostoma ceylanicum]|uniref:Uncharacterized protein n=1 Tax=Ancylostoma ceylanicum TaxID=53326 RepID=A0A016UI13_9BILA|nr:hypothetical protein Y032_0038g3564 [Ancylostoma ceylanicum]
MFLQQDEVRAIQICPYATGTALPSYRYHDCANGLEAREAGGNDVAKGISNMMLKVVSINVNFCVFIPFSICLFCYTAVMYKLKKKPVTETMMAEARICIQVAVFVFAFVLIFMYYLIQLVFTLITVCCMHIITSVNH